MFGPLDPCNQHRMASPHLHNCIHVYDPAHANGRETTTTRRLGFIRMPRSASRRERAYVAEIVDELQSELPRSNPYVRAFQYVCSVAQTGGLANVDLVINPDRRPAGQHARRCNLPTGFGLGEVSVLTNESSTPRDLHVHLRSCGEIQRISETHRSSDPLHFILLFPLGTDGWWLGLPHVGQGDGATTGRCVTAAQCHAYRLMVRSGSSESDHLFRGGKLFQEYCAVSFSKVQTLRLQYLRRNERALRLRCGKVVAWPSLSPRAASLRRSCAAVERYTLALRYHCDWRQTRCATCRCRVGLPKS